MIKYRLSFRKVASTINVVYCEGEFLANPSRATAVNAAMHLRDQPVRLWSAAALLGRYMLRYERKYRRPFKGSREFVMSLHKDINTLIEREGREDVARGIDAVFSDKLKWVTMNHMGFLLNKDNFTKYVVPVMAEPTKAAGEQSEWGQRSDDVASEEVRL